VFLIAACAWPGATATILTPAEARALANGRVFYVSAHGRDSDSGTDPAHAWHTVRRVDDARLAPGDTVLFHGGEQFSDDTLRPGWGSVSGRAGAPVTFASYGRGRAILTDGIWLGTTAPYPDGASYLTFKNLALGPQQGFQGTGNHIALVGLKITNIVHPRPAGETGIETEGSHWLIARNQIDGTGDSGMLLGFGVSSAGDPPGGYDYTVDRNVINRTGLDPALNRGMHGIYLKVSDATIAHNVITNFSDDGVSARYRDAQIVDNYIAGGSIGIAWFQYDRSGGRSRFIDNTIVATTAAGIFVCGVAESCARPLETFVISGNRVIDGRGSFMNLQPGSGRYHLGRNRAW